MMELNYLLRLILGAIFGGIIGWERQREKKPAGLRTHMLVSMGATLFTLVSFLSFTEGGGNFLDPTRIAAGIVAGIGFLGAGAIIQSKKGVTGLTTAASVWTVAAIGMAVGYGLFVLAGSAAVITLIILHILERMEEKFLKNVRK